MALLVCGLRAAPQAEPAEQILQRAIALHQAGKIVPAIAAYEKYLEVRPDSLIALSNLGAAYARAGRYQDAIEQYQRALKLQPGNTQVELNLALADYKLGQAAAAAAILERVHGADPGLLQAMLLLADCWLALGRNKEVIALVAPAAMARQDDLALAYLLGTALVRDGQVERGRIVIDRILRNGESAEARLLMGTAKLHAQDFPGALAELSKAVQLNPKLPDVYTYYGQALAGTGDPVRAAGAFRSALAANPNDFVANRELAALLQQEDKAAEARALYHKALQARPGDLGVRFQLAALDLHAGQTEAARQELESIVREAPAFTEAHVTLATVYYRLKRRQDGDRERAIVERLTRATQAEQQRGINVK